MTPPRIVRADVDRAITAVNGVLRFIGKGLAGAIVPDRYEHKLRAVRDVLNAARPLFPVR